MRRPAAFLLLLAPLAVRPASGADCSVPSSGSALSVVATLPDYAVVTRAIGGNRVSVQAIVQGDQDAHFIRPKPSFLAMVQRAQVLVATGLERAVWPGGVRSSATNRPLRRGPDRDRKSVV